MYYSEKNKIEENIKHEVVKILIYYKFISLLEIVTINQIIIFELNFWNSASLKLKL